MLKKLLLIGAGILILFVGLILLQGMGDGTRSQIGLLFFNSMKALLVQEETLTLQDFSNALNDSPGCKLDGNTLFIQVNSTCSADFASKEGSNLRKLPGIKHNHGCRIKLKHEKNPHAKTEEYPLAEAEDDSVQLNIFENGAHLTIKATGAACTLQF